MGVYNLEYSYSLRHRRMITGQPCVLLDLQSPSSEKPLIGILEFIDVISSAKFSPNYTQRPGN